jgi:uncharacterized coiled-coil protein SlyX
MDSTWITWIIQLVATSVIAIIAYYIKRDQKDSDCKIAEHTTRIAKIEEKLSELPFVYTTREDFIMSMSKVEQKLDRILDRMADINSKKES